MNIFKSNQTATQKTNKKINEANKILTDLENNMSSIITLEHDNKSVNKLKSKLSSLQKDIENLYKLLFPDNINITNNNNNNTNNSNTNSSIGEAEIEFFIENNIFKLFVDYCSYVITNITLLN